MSIMGEFFHGLMTLFKPPPSPRATTAADHYLEVRIDRQSKEARERLLEASSAVRRTVDRVNRRIAGLNGFDHDHDSA